MWARWWGCPFFFSPLIELVSSLKNSKVNSLAFGVPGRIYFLALRCVWSLEVVGWSSCSCSLLLARRKFGVDRICLQAMLCFIGVESSWMNGGLIKEVLASAVGPQSQSNWFDFPIVANETINVFWIRVTAGERTREGKMASKVFKSNYCNRCKVKFSLTHWRKPCCLHPGQLGKNPCR